MEIIILTIRPSHKVFALPLRMQTDSCSSHSTAMNGVSSKHFSDSVNEIIALQVELSHESNKRDIGKTFEVLVEGYSKRSREQFCGRSSQNKMIVFPKSGHKIGDLVMVRVTEVTAATLIGEVVE